MKKISEDVLYISDLDGTLLRRDTSLSDYTAKVLTKLIDEGMQFTYATARSLVSAQRVLAAKGLQVNFPVPVIVYNGVCIRYASSGKILSLENFSREEKEKLFLFLQKNDLHPFVYSFLGNEEKLRWMKEAEKTGMAYLKDRRGDPRLEKAISEKELLQGRVFYFTCIGRKEQLEPVFACREQYPFARFTLQEEIYRPGEYWLEIMPAGASKASALERLRKYMHFRKVVVFGDGENDIPLFQAADEGYAVSNAAEPLQKAADGIILSNEEDGVARWLSENVYTNT